MNEGLGKILYRKLKAKTIDWMILFIKKEWIRVIFFYLISLVCCAKSTLLHNKG